MGERKRAVVHWCPSDLLICVFGVFIPVVVVVVVRVGKRQVLTSLTVEVVRYTTRAQLCRTEKHYFPVRSGTDLIGSVRPRTSAHLLPALKPYRSDSWSKPIEKLIQSVIPLVFGLIGDQPNSDQSSRSSVITKTTPNRLGMSSTLILLRFQPMNELLCGQRSAQTISGRRHLAIPKVRRLVLEIFVSLFNSL